jgi:hypothetical protein
MARMAEHHQHLGPDGVGRCSVPMWSGGLPDGFCDRDAYGRPPPSDTYRDRDGVVRRFDGRYSGYVPALACPAHGGPEAPGTVVEVAS